MTDIIWFCRHEPLSKTEFWRVFNSLKKRMIERELRYFVFQNAACYGEVRVNTLAVRYYGGVPYLEALFENEKGRIVFGYKATGAHPKSVEAVGI